MSYHGAKFPEGVSSEYIEITGVEDITCPRFRRVVHRALSAEDTKYFDCDGCGTKDSLIIVVSPETERIFVRCNSNCTGPIVVEPPKKLTI